MRNAIKATLAMLVLAGVSGAAHANVDAATINTKTAVLNFNAETQVGHQLTVSAAHFDVNATNEFVLANGVVTNGEAAILALRYTPDTAVVRSSSVNHGTLSGDNNPDNKLDVRLDWATGFAGADNTNGWVLTHNAVTEFDYSVAVDKDQTVAPDTYTISVDAGVWTE